MPEPRTAVRTRERHTAVHELVEQGWTIAAISQQLGLSRTTVRKFRKATTAEELINAPAPVSPDRLRSSSPRSSARFRSTAGGRDFGEGADAGVLVRGAPDQAELRRRQVVDRDEHQVGTGY
ncbi:helix-turn-helix domain-containing protein [Nonomuraea sp. NPDC049158]|uniref:helix-turn-helix domain-containing protein n=1 Tax=Nonomuraea sp. NPDC049158 TaxID=3155649 RepID=UPI0034020707